MSSPKFTGERRWRLRFFTASNGGTTTVDCETFEFQDGQVMMKWPLEHSEPDSKATTAYVPIQAYTYLEVENIGS